MDERKTILLLLGLALLILLVNIIIGFSYHEIMGVATILVAVFIGSFQARAFVLTLTRTAVHHYQESIARVYYFAGTEIPTGMALPSGIIMLVLNTGSIPVTDWGYLNMTPLNIINILWYVNAIFAILAAIIGYRYWKAPKPEKTRIEGSPY